MSKCCQLVAQVMLALCVAIPFVTAGLVTAGPWMFPNDPFIDRFYKGCLWGGYMAAASLGVGGVCLVVYSCCESARMRWMRAANAVLVLVGAGGAVAVSVLAYQQVPATAAHESALSLKLRFRFFASVVAAGGASLIVGLMFACWIGSASRREGTQSVPPSVPPSPAVKEAPVEKPYPAVTPSVIVMNNKGDPVAPSAPAPPATVVEGVPYPAL